MKKIVFTRSNSWVSKIIKLFTGGKVSHVGIKIEENQYLHADVGGVQISTEKDFLENGKRRIEAIFEPVGPNEELLDINYGLSLVGRHYDYAGLLGEVVPTLSWRWFKLRLPNFLNDPKKYWCSEFVMSLFKSYPESLSKLDVSTVTPHQLFQAFKSDPGFSKKG